MSDRYFIKHNEDEMYIHFNPHTQVYFIGDKLLGAVTFSESGGQALIRDADLGSDWGFVPVNAKKITVVPRSEESRLFNATH